MMMNTYRPLPGAHTTPTFHGETAPGAAAWSTALAVILLSSLHPTTRFSVAGATTRLLDDPVRGK